MAEQRLSTSTSILIAGAMIALGAYFGLRSREPEPAAAPTSPTTTTLSSATIPAAAPTTSAAPRAEAATAQAPQVDRAKVETLVRERFKPQRNELASKCWKPSLAPSGRYELKLVYTFDADGRELARSSIESREHGSAEVTRCVLDTVQPLALPPIGATATEIAVAVVFPL